MRNPYHAVPGALGPQSGQAAGKLSPELKEQLGSTWDQEDSGYIDILESISFFFFEVLVYKETVCLDSSTEMG